MRSFVLVVLVALAGCPGRFADEHAAGDDGAGGGSGGASAAECFVASDCAPAGPKCCDCPTHAVPVDDPAQRACSDVDCPTPSCGSPMEAACNGGQCELVCSAVACTANVSCPGGFATDGNGCLTCECSVLTSTECGADTDCARVPDDCCGCDLGGDDTAIPAGQVAAHMASLMCPENPSCPGVSTCAPDLAARCVAGQCTLVSGPLPANACGRPDLPACPANEVCTVNADAQATMQGVGVCRPVP
jgi:hypothetical protein